MVELGDWLTTKEAGKLAGYHPDYIRKLVKAGVIEARKWGNAWMINRPSLLVYVKQIETLGEKRGPKPTK